MQLNFTFRATAYLNRVLLSILIFLSVPSFTQTISWSGYTSGSLTYSTGPISAVITSNGTSGHQPGSPFYQPDNSPLPISGDCSSPGLVLFMDWGANANTANYSTTLTINFTECVTGPVTFTIFDVNTDDFSDFGDWIDFSGMTSSGATAAPSVTGCAPNLQTIGNVRRVRGGLAASGNTSGRCTCDYTDVSVGSAGQKITSVAIKYFPDPDAWVSTPHNPSYQYIIISDITVSSLSCTLPVELLSFSGYPEGAFKIFNWATASEFNNNYFTLEHSRDGIHFSAVGENVRGAGTSSQENHYTFEIKDDTGFIYYRLRQTDYDRVYTFSKVIKVDGTLDDDIDIRKAYYNPNSQCMELVIDAPAHQMLDIGVFNVLGEILSSNSVEIFPGSNSFSLPVKTGPPGIKLLSVFGDNIHYIKKLF